LAGFARRTQHSEFHHLDLRRARFLWSRASRVCCPELHQAFGLAERQLRDLGVEVRTNAIVTRLDDREVSIGDERIAARTVLRAASVSTSPLTRHLGVPLDHHPSSSTSASIARRSRKQQLRATPWYPENANRHRWHLATSTFRRCNLLLSIGLSWRRRRDANSR